MARWPTGLSGGGAELGADPRPGADERTWTNWALENLPIANRNFAGFAALGLALIPGVLGADEVACLRELADDFIDHPEKAPAFMAQAVLAFNEQLERIAGLTAEDARRAQVILMLAHGDSFSTITATVGCYPDYINRWKQRFETERLPGLRAKYCGQPATVRTPAMAARSLGHTSQPRPTPTCGSGRTSRLDPRSG